MAKIIKHKGSAALPEFVSFVPRSKITGAQELNEGRRPSTPIPSGGPVNDAGPSKHFSGGKGPYQQRRISRQEEEAIYEHESFEAMMSEAPGQGGISQLGDSLMSRRFDAPTPRPKKSSRTKDSR